MNTSSLYCNSYEELACAVLKAAGESLDRKHSSYLSHLEALVEIHAIVGGENTNQEERSHIDNIDDGYEVTLLEEYAPFDKKSKPKFYPALTALLCEGFQPGSILPLTPPNSIPVGVKNAAEEELLFEYSLPKQDFSVRCARILYSLIAKLPEDIFSLSTLIHTQPSIAARNQQTTQHYPTIPSTTLLTAFAHHITALPDIESRVHALQRSARHVGFKKVTPLSGPLANAESFSERLDFELATHVEIVTAKLLTALYRRSDSSQRKTLRNKIGSILYSFTLHSSSSSQMSTLVSSSSLGERNTSATAIPGILLSLHRIICGFCAPPLHESHKLLLLHLLIPLHKTNAMVLWRDQTPMLALYHEPLVMCISKILDLDTNTSSPLVSKVILALVHPNIWPEGRTSNTPKVVLLLHEIDTLLERHPKNCDMNWFQSVANSLLLRICECISSDNSRVSERALQLWKNKKFEKLVASQLSTYLNPLLRALCRVNTNMEPSWNPSVNKMTALVIRQLEESDPVAFARACNECMGSVTVRDDTAQVGKQLRAPLPENEQQQKQPQPLEQPKSSISQPVDTSLKSAMGSWKPPSRRKPGAAVTSSASSSTRMNNTQSMNPPLTITGVAPWAVTGKNQKSPRMLFSQPMSAVTPKTPSQGKVGLPASIKEKSAVGSASNIFGHISEGGDVELDIAIDEEEEDGDADENTKRPQHDIISDNIEDIGAGVLKFREFMNKISPPSDDGVEAGGNSSFSSWAVAQLSESPVLLRNLKFHDLVFGQELGRGAFSTVKYARRIIKNITRSNWPEYAVKIISTSRIQELGYEASVNREIAILRVLSHPGIARLVSSFRFQDGAYLVLEYASKGDLHDLLRTNGSLDHESTRFVIGEVVAALNSVHDVGFVYSDLKPENILITESGHAKLTDFGACRPVTYSAKQLIKASGTNAICKLRDGNWKATNDDSFTSKESSNEATKTVSVDLEDDNRIEGTTAYLPPEVAMGGTPSPAADSWALGCVLYQCISGKPPILGDTDEQTVHKIVAFRLEGKDDDDDMFFGHRESSAFRPETKALVRCLLNLNLNERPSMFAIAQHEFFSGMDVFTLYKRSAPALMQGSIAPVSIDAKWTRRQFSSIWAPQPKAYLLGAAPKAAKMPSDVAIFDDAVEEGAELDASFVPKASSAHTLSKIKEMFA